MVMILNSFLKRRCNLHSVNGTSGYSQSVLFNYSIGILLAKVVLYSNQSQLMKVAKETIGRNSVKNDQLERPEPALKMLQLSSYQALMDIEERKEQSHVQQLIEFYCINLGSK
jgi:hypothetical protein